MKIIAAIDSFKKSMTSERAIQAVIPIIDAPVSLKEAMNQGAGLLKRAVKRAFHLVELK